MVKKVKVGAAFSDFVYTQHTPFLKLKRGNSGSTSEVKMRDLVFPAAILFALVFLLGRLFWLQIFKGEEYKVLSDSNRTRTAVIHAPRGIIFDRNGKPLVYNTPGYRKTINGKTSLIDQKTAMQLLANGDKQLEIDSLRQYPYKDEFAHVVGIIGQISDTQLKDPQFAGYKVGDVIGEMGLEQQYEAYLKGADGQMLVEVDATGKLIRTLGVTDPIAGQNITTTLDVDLQKAAFDATKDVKKGAVIVSKPNGEILAMVSRPSFDPNLFTMGAHYDDAAGGYTLVEDILGDSDSQPLLNRAIAGTYPPGSTFKLITAAAGLEDKKIDKNFTVDDTGILTVGTFSFSNWYYSQYGRTEGPVDVVKAIKRSNDIFFYKLGELLGVDAISQEAEKFGLGDKTGIDLVGEQKGLLPTKQWKKTALGEQWYLGDDYHYGIGQGYLLTTPMQVNVWTQALANEGTIYAPHILKVQNPIVKRSGFLEKDTVNLIREGMIEACQDGGVAYPLFNFAVKNDNLAIDGKNFLNVQNATSGAHLTGVSIACKTGTAQHGDEKTLPHAWITLFAPAYNPEIVVTVLAEDSGEGSNVAAPIAKKILEAYFTKKN